MVSSDSSDMFGLSMSKYHNAINNQDMPSTIIESLKDSHSMPDVSPKIVSLILQDGMLLSISTPY